MLQALARNMNAPESAHRHFNYHKVTIDAPTCIDETGITMTNGKITTGMKLIQ